jgi:DNA repair photolyase
LSFGAGTDFERKIVVKPEAPALLRAAFERPSWRGELIVFSGNTDCYQPLEASYRLTRGCLEVCAEYRNPVAIITKAPLIERDLDVLGRLAEVASAHVTISVPFWDPSKARAIEPFVATPQRRLHTIAKLASAGLSVGVNFAPLIPGLNDDDLVPVLEAAAAAGARHAGLVFLRLPGSVAQVFAERLRQATPLRAARVLARIRESQGGVVYDPRFGKRGKAVGAYGTAIQSLYETTVKRLGMNAEMDMVDDETTFCRPSAKGGGKGQLPLL